MTDMMNIRAAPPDGSRVELSPAVHHELQRLIVETFATHFALGSVLACLIHTAKHLPHVDHELMEQIGIQVNNYDKLPDVVLFDKDRNRLFLIEAVTSRGRNFARRHAAMEEALKGGQIGRVYVRAFMNFTAFKKYAADIVWESEVWIADFPDHMIHFNGDKFMGPYPQRREE
jgi:hypothetical protein